MNKKDKVILIAGATSMIGRSLAVLLNKDYNKLILLGRDKDKLEKLIDEMTQNQGITEA